MASKYSPRPRPLADALDTPLADLVSDLSGSARNEKYLERRTPSALDETCIVDRTGIHAGAAAAHVATVIRDGSAGCVAHQKATRILFMC